MEHENFGEASKKKSAEVYENERPLKKARYLWQVKGKYHLKDSSPSMISDTDEVKSDLSEENPGDNFPRVLQNNNVRQTRNKNLCNDRACIEDLIAKSDKIMEYPDVDSPPKNIDKSISDEIPITLVKPHTLNDDYYLRKWQARQIAKGFVDNTINRVLESWLVAPFDAADFVENCESGGKIEDEGILMAIQSHGLQSDQSTSRLFSSRQNQLTPQASWEPLNSCSCTKSQFDAAQNVPMPLFHQRSMDEQPSPVDSPKKICFLPNSEHLKPIEKMEDTPNPDTNFDCLKMDDTDFLDAAVAVAIQKKGLTSLNCVDCG